MSKITCKTCSYKNDNYCDMRNMYLQKNAKPCGYFTNFAWACNDCKYNNKSKGLIRPYCEYNNCYRVEFIVKCPNKKIRLGDE